MLVRSAWGLCLLAGCSNTILGDPTAGGSAGPGGSGGSPPLELTLEADGQLDPEAIAADDQAIYWTNRGTNVDNEYPLSDGSVVRLPHDGSGMTTLSAGGSPGDIAVDDAYVYWTDGPYVWRADKATGDGAVVKAVAPNYLSRISLHEETLYFQNGMEIRKVAKAGGVPETLVDGDGNPRRFVADHTDLYFADYALGDDLGFVGKVNVGGGPLEILAPDQPEPWAIVVDIQSIYWSVNQSDVGSSDGAVYRMKQTGGPPELVAGGMKTVHDIVHGGDALYWGNYTSGPLLRASLPDLEITELVSSTSCIDLALGPERVYWVEPYSESGGRIWSIGK